MGKDCSLEKQAEFRPEQRMAHISPVKKVSGEDFVESSIFRDGKDKKGG